MRKENTIKFVKAHNIRNTSYQELIILDSKKLSMDLYCGLIKFYARLGKMLKNDVFEDLRKAGRGLEVQEKCLVIDKCGGEL